MQKKKHKTSRALEEKNPTRHPRTQHHRNHIVRADQCNWDCYLCTLKCIGND